MHSLQLAAAISTHAAICLINFNQMSPGIDSPKSINGGQQNVLVFLFCLLAFGDVLKNRVSKNAIIQMKCLNGYMDISDFTALGAVQGFEIVASFEQYFLQMPCCFFWFLYRLVVRDI